MTGWKKKTPRQFHDALRKYLKKKGRPKFRMAWGTDDNGCFYMRPVRFGGI